MRLWPVRAFRMCIPGYRAAAVLVLLLSLSACSRGSAGDPAVPPGGSAAGGRAGGRGAGGGARGAGGAVAVTTATAEEKPMAVNVRAVGNVEASSNVEIRAQVAGELLSVEFTEGQDVTAGQLLFTIDPRTYDVAVKQAEATLARDTAQAKGAQAQLARSDDLLARGLVSRAEHESLSTQAAALAALMQADGAQVENANLQLQHTKITAPVSGRTGALLVHRGSLIRANDTTPLVVINQVSPVFVSFAVPSRLLPQLRTGRARGTLIVRAEQSETDGPPAKGTLSFIDNAVDQTTDTIRLKATFPNGDRRLWPGAFVNVVLQLALDPHAVVVPDAAPQAGQDGEFVFVVKPDQTVEARPIKVGWSEGGETVVQDGLRAGETVVTDGQLRLIPGARVTIKPADNQPKGQP